VNKATDKQKQVSSVKGKPSCRHPAGCIPALTHPELPAGMVTSPRAGSSGVALRFVCVLFVLASLSALLFGYLQRTMTFPATLE